MDSKIDSLSNAVSIINNKSHISFSGFAHSIAPMAFVREMIRQRRQDLEISAVGEAWAVDMLSGAGLLSKVRLSNFMFEGWGRCHNFSREVEEGNIEVEDYSHYGMINKFLAGSMGIPFLPTKVMNGTDIVNVETIDKSNKFKEYTCPFSKEKVILLPKIQPDFAIIHSSRADKNGNIQLFGISSSTEEIAKAAKYVIVTTEEIVEEEVIRKNPSNTILPGFLIDKVVHVPYGAHPSGMYQYYDYDVEHIDIYIKASKTKKDFNKYLQNYVFNCENHLQYLKQMGISHLLNLRADPYYGYSLKGREEKYV